MLSILSRSIWCNVSVRLLCASQLGTFPDQAPKMPAISYGLRPLTVSCGPIHCCCMNTSTVTLMITCRWLVTWQLRGSCSCSKATTWNAQAVFHSNLSRSTRCCNSDSGSQFSKFSALFGNRHVHVLQIDSCGSHLLRPIQCNCSSFRYFTPIHCPNLVSLQP
jgi:hypothetical protein